jgi:hypothetical protein
MANFYKNAFYDPTVTTAVTVYTCPSNANAIIQNIQVTNESGSKILKVSISDDSVSTVFQIAYASITGPTICNLAKGPIVLEETDTIRLESSNVTSGISATLAILEINRDDQNGQ